MVEIGSARLTVEYDSRGYGVDGDVQRVEVSGSPEEHLESALHRTLGTPPGGAKFHVVVPHFDGMSGYWLGAIDEHVTLGDMVAFADGDVINIDLAGRGGGALPLLWDVIGGISTLAWLIELGRGAEKQILAARARHKRIAAKEWLDAGIDTEPSMALKQFVFEEREWRRKDFDAVFGLDGMSGPYLLRSLGYEKTSTDPETWAEKD